MIARALVQGTQPCIRTAPHAAARNGTARRSERRIQEGLVLSLIGKYGRRFALIAAGLVALAFLIPAAWADDSLQQHSAAVISNFTGEWIGTCEQSTDGEEAENKYFHAKFQQTGDNTFAGKFTYYRFDMKTGEALNIGETTITSTVQADGTIRNEIVGKGKVLVNNDPKDQQHEVTEILTIVDDKTMKGKIDGKISVSGLPLGIGRNGRIRNAESTWKLEDGALCIDQTLKAAFKVLMVSRNFTVEAHNSARRGSDVVGLMKSDLASKPASKPAPGS